MEQAKGKKKEAMGYRLETLVNRKSGISKQAKRKK
jgi:hypothetical protein